jgi:hypothetical protein
VVKYTATVTCAACKPVHKNGCGPLQPPQINDHIRMIFSDTHNLIFSQILRQDFTTINKKLQKCLDMSMNAHTDILIVTVLERTKNVNSS